MDQSCFNTALELLQTRDSSSLIESIKRVIALNLPGARSEIFEVATAGSAQFRQHGSTAQPTPDIEQHLAHALNNRKALCIKSDDKRATFYYPVSGVGRVKLIFAINAGVGDSGTLEQLIMLFRTQFILMDKNNHDALTSLLNRQAFEDRMQGLIENRSRRAREDDSDHCFALLDIDHFKNVNDTYGHLYGDEVLILFAGIMDQTFRGSDMLFRYGGEEFAVVLSDTDIATAEKVLERFRSKVESFDFPQVGRITMSAGVTPINKSPTVVSLIQNADKALYYSKEHGRNQVNSYEQLTAEGKLEASETSKEDDIELF